jgi:hypothetical protein
MDFMNQRTTPEFAAEKNEHKGFNHGWTPMNTDFTEARKGNGGLKCEPDASPSLFVFMSIRG